MGTVVSMRHISAANQTELVMPTGDKCTSDAATMKSQHRFVTKCGDDGWRPRICWLLGAVRPEELDPIGHEQNRRRVPPDRLKPAGLGARVKQRNPVVVPG